MSKTKIVEIEDFDGVSKKFTLSALPVGWLRDNADSLAKIGPNVTDSVDGMVGVIEASLKRKHPDVSAEQLLDALTMTEAQELMDTILEMSGLNAKGGVIPETPSQAGSSEN